MNKLRDKKLCQLRVTLAPIVESVLITTLPHFPVYPNILHMSVFYTFYFIIIAFDQSLAL